jgi:hypothetical protein
MRPGLFCVLAALALSVTAVAPVQAQSPAPSPSPPPSSTGNEKHTMSWPNGDTFTGVFRDGLPNGPGSYTTGGRTYTGDWKDGCLSTPGGRRFAVNTTLDKCPPWRKPGFTRPDIR